MHCFLVFGTVLEAIEKCVVRFEVNHPDFKKYDTASMINVGGGGAAFAAPMIKRVQAGDSI